jgi:hypothetical protein
VDDAEQAWYDQQEEKIEEALELAWRSQITYPWFFDFFEYFDEKIVQHHEERDEFLQHYRDQNSEAERVFDRDDIRHVDSIYDAVCDECDTVQFSLRGFEDATYCNSCYYDLDFDNQDSLSSFDNETYVLVGCGKQKDATGITAAKEVYQSSYFEKKQGFAEEFSDEWYIISGKFGLLHNETTIWDYDASIEDVDTDEWMDVVEENLDSWLDWNQGDEVYVLIGRKYLDAEAGDGRTLRSLLTEAEPETYFPFEQTSGIGKQKQYLGDAVEYGEPVMPYNLPGFEDQTALDSF